MPRLMSDVEAARAAAITAMGMRLAAAGPRTRRRMRDRQAWADESGDRWEDEGQGYAAVADTYWPEPGSDAPPVAWSWHDIVTAARRCTLLVSAAACGFGVVLIGLNMSLAHRADRNFRRLATSSAPPAPIIEDVASGTLVPPDPVRGVTSLSDPTTLRFAVLQPPNPTVDAVANAALAPPEAVQEVASLSDPADRSVAAVLPAPPDVTPRDRQVATSRLASVAPVNEAPRILARPQVVRLAVREPVTIAPASPSPRFRPKEVEGHDVAAAATRGGETLADLADTPMALPALHARATRPDLHPARLVLARYQHPASARDFDVTGWLAREPAPAPRVLIMSPPPHMLTHPQEKVVAEAAPAPVVAKPATTPVQRRLPPLVVASSGYPAPDVAEPPAYRPYYPPAYGYQYGAPGMPYYPPAYGGYYGGPPQ